MVCRAEEVGKGLTSDIIQATTERCPVTIVEIPSTSTGAKESSKKYLGTVMYDVHVLLLEMST